MKFVDPSGEWVMIAVFALYSAWNMGLKAGIAAERSGGHFWRDGFWKGAIAGAFIGSAGYIAGGAAVNFFNIGGIFSGAAIGSLTGAAVGGIGGGLSSWAMGGDFWDGAKHGALIGGISGAFSGGLAGYGIAKADGKNLWWGSEIKDGRTQWSFFTSEKHYEEIQWNIRDVGSKSPNDCVPTSFTEANDFFGGTTSYERYKAITNYQDGVGTFTNQAGYEKMLSEQFLSTRFDPSMIADPKMMRELQNRGYLLHTNMPYGGIRHADNLRSIRYYRSGKVKLNYRIGSRNLSSVDNNWWFYLLRGLK